VAWEAAELEWELVRDGGGCRLALTATVADARQAAHSAAGWHAALEMLDDVLACRRPGDTGPEAALPALVAHYRRALA
jgi:hypothetical protein